MMGVRLDIWCSYDETYLIGGLRYILKSQNVFIKYHERICVCFDSLCLAFKMEYIWH